MKERGLLACIHPPPALSHITKLTGCHLRAALLHQIRHYRTVLESIPIRGTGAGESKLVFLGNKSLWHNGNAPN